ncbi:MAG: hypothetical protein IJE41_01120, partial [Clostridia bacterium]|nr:hypothetical protein [Clostridia bacterium]
NAKDIYFMLGKGIHHIRMELGYETFSIWANGKLWLDDYKYTKSQKGHISQIIWRSCIDNLMLYDGGEYSLMPSTSAQLIEIPGADSNSYTFSSVYSDGAAVSKELTYTLAEEYEGVSLEGNVLTVSKTAELVPIIVNVTDGFANGTVKKHVKTDYILVNDEIYTEGEDIINTAGTYTIKAGYGFSDQKISGSMYIAQYEGGKLVKVIPVKHDGETPINLSAVLSENFSETGTARVFIWNGNMSPIKSDVTIQ